MLKRQKEALKNTESITINSSLAQLVRAPDC